MNSRYTGVYSEVNAGTSVGTRISHLSDQVQGPGVTGLNVDDSKTKGRQYQVISKSTLEDADLNVAKIRLVTTLPGKDIPEEMRGKAYVGFILTGVQESHSEKVEVVNLPGDTFASYFYGAAPRQFNFSGILLNTDQDQWRDSFEEIYEKYLRGSVSSRNYSIVQISYNGRVVSGWLTNLTQQLNSDNDHYASFSFSVLVSRIDMVGGSKKFSDYLVRLADDGGDFKGANIDADYAVLDPTNFNGMIDPIRTGMVIPPKRPHKSRGKKKKVTANCYFPAEKTEAGQATNTGAATASTHINDATQCTVFEAINGTNDLIEDKIKQARELLATKDGKPPTQKQIDQAAQLEADAKLLDTNLRKALDSNEVKEQLAAEALAQLELNAQIANQIKEGQTPTESQRRAKKALDDRRIQVGDTTIEIKVTEEGKLRLDDYTFAYADRGAELFQGGKNPTGLGDKAQKARLKADDDARKAHQRAEAKRKTEKLARAQGLIP